MSDLQYWLALNSLSDIGPVAVGRLLAAFGCPEDIFRMSGGDLRKVEGIGEKKARSITGFNAWGAVQQEIEKAERTGVRLIPLDDGAYPSALKRIHNAPLVLYVKGQLQECDTYAVAMVGSRSSSDYGMQVAEKMAGALARSGLTVVSGMARGIDTASHAGALKAGGRTIAVLGSGVDVPYPASNRKLMEAIVSSGAVISEFPFGTGPGRENFPRRNRIISGLSFGTVVVEAALDSGSLITVAYALEQGRDVFAVPGNITSANSRGTNDLIRKGARLVESAEEIIAELGPQLKGVLREAVPASEKKLPDMTDEERGIYRYLNAGPRHIDSIIREMSMAAGKVTSLLLHLELKGIIRQSRGNLFSLN